LSERPTWVARRRAADAGWGRITPEPKVEEEIVMSTSNSVIIWCPQDPNTDFVLTVPGGSKASGAELVLSAIIRGSASQLWDLQETGEIGSGAPFVYIINKNSGLALTVPNSPRFAKGAAVVQTSLKHSDNQKWLQAPAPQQGLYYFANKWSGFNIDGSTSPVTQEETGTDFGGGYQLWVLEPEAAF
jgi:Ricin-type beta-trefoil lectin domain-like